MIDAEIKRLCADGLSDVELAAAKGHLIGSLAMSLETSASRMRRLGRAEMVEGDVPSLDELVARIERVTADDVSRVIDRVFRDAPRTLAVVGPHEASEFSVGLRTTARRRCGRGGRHLLRPQVRVEGRREVHAGGAFAVCRQRSDREYCARAGRGRCGMKRAPPGSSSARCPSINAAFAAPATRSEVPNDSIRPPTTSSS